MILARQAAGVHQQGWGRAVARYVDESDPFIMGLIVAGHIVPLEPLPKEKPKRRPRKAT